jgi:hypothetical protein
VFRDGGSGPFHHCISSRVEYSTLEVAREHLHCQRGSGEGVGWCQCGSGIIGEEVVPVYPAEPSKERRRFGMCVSNMDPNTEHAAGGRNPPPLTFVVASVREIAHKRVSSSNWVLLRAVSIPIIWPFLPRWWPSQWSQTDRFAACLGSCFSSQGCVQAGRIVARERFILA